MHKERIIYRFESGPLDYWENWHDILDFSEVVSAYISNYPKDYISYLKCKDDMNELLVRVLRENKTCTVNEMRGYDFHFYFDSKTVGCDQCGNNQAEELRFVLAHKEDNNGTVAAFSFDCFIDSGHPLKTKYYESDETFLKLHKDYERIELIKGVIPNDFGCDWELINPFFQETK